MYSFEIHHVCEEPLSPDKKCLFFTIKFNAGWLGVNLTKACSEYNVYLWFISISK